ncbi:effector-associated domain EAD1-containing protein [Acrocarpospora macrocephala]|uniref:effector-associated domain EAD1-containing protein n=1 Tax=Acrocarpospora macrocephala TaxID=150177 RepID=UPI0012D32875|nr:effector-associated domain EAD1-containing protein [Acrocarpospora macrocephala]
MSDALSDAEVAAFAAAYPTVRAEKLLWTARFPDSVIPSTVLNAGDFWSEVSRVLANGAFPGGRRRLLALAHRSFPANAAFAAGRVRRVLLVGASPDEEVALRADRELREIRKAARLGHLEVASVLAAQVSDLRAVLAERPDILHLSVHGDGTYLYFESALGDGQPVAARDVVTTLARYRDADQVRLTGLILQSCESESVAAEFLDVAEVVVAHRGRIDDACAVLFAGRLYEELRDTPSLPSAVRNASADDEPSCDFRDNVIVLVGRA